MKPELLLIICFSGYEAEFTVWFPNTLFLFAMQVVGAYMLLFSFMALSSTVLLTLLFLLAN